MPWKLILLLLGMLILLIFAVLNAANVSDISLGFYVFKDVPVFMSLYVSFVAGALFSLPFAVSSRRKKKAKLAVKGSDQPAAFGDAVPAETPSRDSVFSPNSGEPLRKEKRSRSPFKKKDEKAAEQVSTADSAVTEKPFEPNPDDNL